MKKLLQTLLSYFISRTDLRDAVLARALSKITSLGMTPEDAVKIIRDEQTRTEDKIPNLGIDEGVSVATHVLLRKTRQERILAVAGIVLAFVTSWVSNNLITKVFNTPKEIPEATKQNIHTWVNENYCTSDICVVNQIVQTGRDSYIIKYKDGGSIITIEQFAK